MNMPDRVRDTEQGLQVQNQGQLIQLPNSALKRLTSITNSASFNDNGVSLMEIVDLTAPPIARSDEVMVQATLEAAYGTDYSQQRIDILFDLCRKKGWSGERLRKTAEWMISNKPWVAWAVSDFLTASGSRLYPYPSWYEREASKRKIKIDIYKVGDVLMCREQDGVDLPFEKVEPEKAPDRTIVSEGPIVPMPQYVKDQMNLYRPGLSRAFGEDEDKV